MSKKQKVPTKGKAIFGNSLDGMLDPKQLEGLALKPNVNEPEKDVSPIKEKEETPL